MTYNEAKTEKDKLRHLIGRQYRGASLEEILIAPVDPMQFQSFSERYIQSFDGEIAVAPYVNSSLRLIAVFDRQRIHQGIFFQTDIENLKNDPDFNFEK